MRQRLRQGLNELPEAIREMRHHDAASSAWCLQSAEKNFKNLEGFTEPLGQQRRAKLPTSIVEAVDGLDSSSRNSPCCASALNNREGTIGR